MSETGPINQLSFAPLFVQAVMLGRGDAPEVRKFPASAFLVGHPPDLMLVSARHVVAGEDLHGNPLDSTSDRAVAKEQAFIEAGPWLADFHDAHKKD